MNNKILIIFFSVIVLLAIFIRFFRLGQIPVSLYWDETAILLDAKSIAESGQDIHGQSWWQSIFYSYGDYKLPIYIWAAALTIKIFSANEWSLRLPSAIAGVLTVLISALITKKLFEKKITSFQSTLLFLSTALIVCISPWSIHFSRTGFEGHLGQFFLALAVYFLLLSKQKKYLILLSILSAVLSTYTYFSIRFVWPILYFVIYIYLNKSYYIDLYYAQKTISKIKVILFNISTQLIIPLLFFLICLQPLFKSPYYQISNQFRLSTQSIFNIQDWSLIASKYQQMAGNTFIAKIIYHRHLFLFKELLKNYSHHLSLIFLFISGDSNLRHGTAEYGLFLFPLILVFLVGLFQLAKHHRLELIVLISWIILALFPASIPEETPHALRSLNALVPYSIIIGYGLMVMIDYSLNDLSVRGKSPINFRLMLMLFFFLLMSFSCCQFLHHYFIHYPSDSAAVWQDPYKIIAQKIYQKQNTYNQILIKNFDNRFYLWLLTFNSYTHQDLLKYDLKIVKKIDKIDLDFYNFTSLMNNSYSFVLVGKKDTIEKILNDNNLIANELEYIKNYNFEDEYLFAYFKNES